MQFLFQIQYIFNMFLFISTSKSQQQSGAQELIEKGKLSWNKCAAMENVANWERVRLPDKNLIRPTQYLVKIPRSSENHTKNTKSGRTFLKIRMRTLVPRCSKNELRKNKQKRWTVVGSGLDAGSGLHFYAIGECESEYESQFRCSRSKTVRLIYC